MTAKFTGAIADWLASLGLSGYAERFAENDIDMAVLRDLTIRTSRISGFRLSVIVASCCARLVSLTAALRWWPRKT